MSTLHGRQRIITPPDPADLKGQSVKRKGLNKQTYGASYDQQLLVNLFTDCIEASIVLGVDPEFRETMKKLIPKLTPQKIGKYGQIQEWPNDLDSPKNCLLYTSPSPRDQRGSRMPSSA